MEPAPVKDHAAEHQPGERVSRARSSGPTHSQAIKLGIIKSRVAAANKLAMVQEDSKVALVRNVFGKFNAVATAAGMHVSQNMVLFQAADGSVEAYDYAAETSTGMYRQRSIGIYSHMIAQRDALTTFLQRRPSNHAIASGLKNMFLLFREQFCERNVFLGVWFV